ncbi:hypothetical protein [Sporosarcina sp. FSL K6-1508]|uniref:hypothetical protein n=1 Tax=Sporosarcina sp. FSL K6-1508 TaxID=2921553 RepID=UPI0030FCA7F0
MSLIQWLAIISISGLIVSISIAIYYVLRGKKNNELSFNYDVKRATWKSVVDSYSQKMYLYAIRIPLLRSFVRHVRSRIETLSIYDEYALRRQIMFTLYNVFALLLSLVVVLLLVRPSWLIVFWFFLGCLFISSLLVDFFVHRVEMRLLKQLKEFINRIRIFFHETKMVEEAVYAAIPYAGPEMKVQANRIYQILTSEDPEEEFAKYEQVVPSRFLKGVTGLLLMVKEQGDVVTNEGSSLTNGLSRINEELNSEFMFRSVLYYQTKGFPLLAIVPVFVAQPLKVWALNHFSFMNTFYESQLGLIVEVSSYALAVMMYMLFRKMGEVKESKYQASMKNLKWEKWMLEKSSLLQNIVTRITPGPHTKKYLLLSKLLKDANSGLKMDWLTLQRMVITISVLVLLTGGLYFSHERDKRSVLYNVVPYSMLAGNVSAEEFEVYQEATTFDREIIHKLKKLDKVTPEIMEVYIAKSLGVDDLRDPKLKMIHDRIADKYEKFQNAYLKWYEFLFVLLMAVGAWYFPVLLLKFQRHLRFKDMEKEIHQLLVWISILRKFDRISVYTMLIWLERMATVFKDPIRYALQDYDAGPEEALEKLGDTVNFEPFNQLVDRLQLSITRISIQEAFDDVEIERAFYLEQLQENNRRSLNLKDEWSSMLCYLPVLFLITANLLIPLLYLSVVDMQEMVNNIRNI